VVPATLFFLDEEERHFTCSQKNYRNELMLELFKKKKKKIFNTKNDLQYASDYIDKFTPRLL